MPSLSIKKTAPLAILFPLLTCVGLLGWIGYENGRQTANKLAEQTMANLTNQIDENLHEFLSQPLLINKSNAEAIRLGQVDLNKPDSLLTHFWSQMQLFEYVNGIQFGYETGMLRAIVREGKSTQQELTFDVVNTSDGEKNLIKKYNIEGKGNRAKQPSGPARKYFTQQRLWYVRGKEAGKPESVWTEIFKKRTTAKPELRLSAVQPVYQQNKLVGVLCVDFFLSQVSEFLKKKVGSNNTLIFIVDQEGKLVASSTDSDEKPIFKDIKNNSEKIERLKASQSNDKLIKATGIEIATHYQNSIDKTQDKSFLVEKGVSEVQRVQVRRFQNRNLDWLVVVVVPERVFMQSIQNTRYVAMVLAVCTVGISVILGLWVIRWLINPILQLSNAAEKIVSEQFDVDSLDLVTKRNDEIGELARVFQQMANVVYTREKSLKQQVQDLISETDKAKKAALAQQQAGIDLQALLARSQKARTNK